MKPNEQTLKALEFFKDWSNYMLVTTVAALGWVAAKDACVHSQFVVWCFALSSAFGIFTLALIPIVAEQITESTKSLYDVKARFRPFWMWRKERQMQIKWVCWPQHILFIVGIVAYAWMHT